MPEARTVEPQRRSPQDQFEDCIRRLPESHDYAGFQWVDFVTLTGQEVVEMVAAFSVPQGRATIRRLGSTLHPVMATPTTPVTPVSSSSLQNQTVAPNLHTLLQITQNLGAFLSP